MAVARLLRRLPGVSRDAAYRFGLVERPHYAYGVRRATESAARLGLPGVTLVEFGVAGGSGLLALAEHAGYYAKATGVEVRIVGFDAGDGLPPGRSVRDLPYLFGAGFYPMDKARLVSRLGGAADVVIGDVTETVPRYLETNAHTLRTHPVGFVSFDLDYYSSTVSALNLFRGGDPGRLLPRVTCYLDDLPGTIAEIGEAAAMAEFNAEHDDRAISRVLGLRPFIPFDPPWADQIYVHHYFSHPHYPALEAGATGDRLPLTD
ncbi:hypothetical protein [Streptomyces sp. NPDC051567]|uniref:hypothetical protein n=1 Tax=Streptomyces sp. NPDC051567 TaxID=3365660 RepID=UPI003788F966